MDCFDINFIEKGQTLNNQQCAANGTIPVTFVRSALIDNDETHVTLGNSFEEGGSACRFKTTSSIIYAPYRFEILP